MKLRDQSPFFVFQLFGYCLGGVIPIVAAGFLHHRYQNIFHVDSFTQLLTLGTIALLLGFTTLFILAYNSERPPETRIIFVFQALFSIYLIHYIVSVSGGAINSAFGLSYIYLPAVIGYTYGVGREFFAASLLLLCSFFTNLIVPCDQYAIAAQFYRDALGSIGFWESDVAADGYRQVGFACISDPKLGGPEEFSRQFLHGLIFVIQLGVTCVIARRDQLLEQESAQPHISREPSSE